MEKTRRPLFKFLPLFLAVFLVGLSCRAGLKSDLPVIPLKIDGHEILVEVANKEATRSSGLMFRQKMDWDNGMLFVFRDSSTQAFWMKNTVMPLSIAFIDENGVIKNIIEMQPQSLDSNWSNGPVKYALEMNAGWFTKEGVKAGDVFQGLQNAPKAEE